MSSVKKQPTLLVAEIEEAGALPQVLRSQTSRCVVLNLVVHGALIARVVLVVFVVFVVLIVLVVLYLALWVFHGALIALVVLVVFVALVVLIVLFVLDFVVCVIHGALIALDVLVVVVVQAIRPLSWIRCFIRWNRNFEIQCLSYVFFFKFIHMEKFR